MSLEQSYKLCRTGFMLVGLVLVVIGSVFVGAKIFPSDSPGFNGGIALLVVGGVFMFGSCIWDINVHEAWTKARPAHTSSRRGSVTATKGQYNYYYNMLGAAELMGGDDEGGEYDDACVEGPPMLA